MRPTRSIYRFAHLRAARGQQLRDPSSGRRARCRSSSSTRRSFPAAASASRSSSAEPADVPLDQRTYRVEHCVARRVPALPRPARPVRRRPAARGSRQPAGGVSRERAVRRTDPDRPVQLRAEGLGPLQRPAAADLAEHRALLAARHAFYGGNGTVELRAPRSPGPRADQPGLGPGTGEPQHRRVGRRGDAHARPRTRSRRTRTRLRRSRATTSARPTIPTGAYPSMGGVYASTSNSNAPMGRRAPRRRSAARRTTTSSRTSSSTT